MSGVAWAELKTYAHNANTSIKQNLEFHQNLRIKNWARQNDMLLKMISGKIDRWYEEDGFYLTKADLVSLPFPFT